MNDASLFFVQPSNGLCHLIDYVARFYFTDVGADLANLVQGKAQDELCHKYNTIVEVKVLNQLHAPILP